MEPKGTIVFTTVGRPHYGFDIFSVKLPCNFDLNPDKILDENRLTTDGVSINFNGQFIGDDDDDDDDENHLNVVYVSERTGSSQIYYSYFECGATKTDAIPSSAVAGATTGLFHDRPIVKNGRLYFISAHEPSDQVPFKSWCALYSVGLKFNHDNNNNNNNNNNNKAAIRLTPYGCADYSPALSQSGKFIAVASYGSRPWEGEFHDLQTDIVVFPESDPTNRVILCQHGGWPTWSGDSTIYFHRQADDGWWSIYRLDLPADTSNFSAYNGIQARRVTPPGLHCFTPAAMHNRHQIAITTRRPGKNFRHVEIFDVGSQKQYPVTELLNPTFHHYNPFVFSADSGAYLGYHRFRGESGESIIPHLDPVSSPINGLRMLRLNGSFPSFSPNGDLIAFNHDFDSNSGIKVVKSDGSKRWTLLRDRTAFYNSWCPTENNVIFTSIGPIFDSVKATVQIARISFDPTDLRSGVDDIHIDVKILTREDTGNNAFPSCSPDGKSLVFRSGRTGHKNLYILDAVNGEFNGDGGIRQLTNGSWIDTMPSWSPDGKLIAFSSNRHNPDNVDAFSIYVIRPDGTDIRRIYVAGCEGSEAVDRERINHVCFSADGEWLLFTANLGGVTAEPVSLPNQFQPYGDLHVVRLDGSGLRRLTWNGYENGTPAWHPGDELDLGRLSLEGCAGDELKGQFDEPLWIQCDL